jgi:predicted methyltransferase
MSEQGKNGNGTLPPLLTRWTAERISAAIEAGEREIRVSLDLGLSEDTVTWTGDHLALRDYRLERGELERLHKRDTVVFAIDEDGAWPLEIREGGYAKLVPLEGGLGAPTFEISGIKMHRTLGIDPFNDARTKAAAAVSRGDRVLDTCGGLGYTATWARRLGVAAVVSVERDPDVLALRKYNPWSREYLKDVGVEKVEADVAQTITGFKDASFQSIIHDPPRFSLAGELYGEEFLWQLARVLAFGGRLVFYTGQPYRFGRGRNFIEGIEKRLQRLRLRGVWNEALQSIVAGKS